MNMETIETLSVRAYREGLAACLAMIQRGQEYGLSLEDSVDAAKKAIARNNQGEI